MGTIRRLTDLQLGSIMSTKVLTVGTSETLYQISSGARAFEAGNLGVTNIFYGQSNLLATSGLYIASNGGSKFWDTITDNFSMYFVCTTYGQIIVQEYSGN